MKKTFKTLALVLTLCLVSGIFAGCGSKGASNGIGEGEKYTYWVTLDTRAAETISTYADLLLYKEVTKATGVDIEFIHPSQGSTGSEAFQILLSSGDYPDIIEYNWQEYSGGPDMAIEDGVIVALNDYLEEYAPNYYALMEGKSDIGNGKNYKTSAISTNGNHYGFKTLCVGSYGGYCGLYVRKDMLDEWGLDIPVTIDDWTLVFKTAKEHGVKYPLTGDIFLFGYNRSNTFNNAWNVGKSFYLEGDEVKFGPFEPAYKDYIKQMADWTKKGYVDIDFVTNQAVNVEGYMTNGTSVASFGWVGSSIGKLIPAMREKDPDYSVVACPYPVMNEGDEPWFQDISSPSVDPTAAISAQCMKDDETRIQGAMKWMDYLYSEEGMLLKSFGVEGETYTVEKDEEGNKRYKYTDVIYDHEKIGAHSVQAALYHFFRPAAGPGFGDHPDYLDGFYPYDEQKDAIVVWNKYVDKAKEHMLPNSLTYTDEEAAERANILSKGEDNLNAAIMDTILGKRPLKDFDKAIADAKKAGFNRLLEITQAAYNRYLELEKK